jgi:twinkle protein
MTGRQIDALPHSCGTKKGLKVFSNDDDTITGYCFSCGTFVKHPYGEDVKLDIPKRKEKTSEDIQAEIAEVQTYPVTDVPERKLRADVLDSFGAKTSMSETDGVTPTAIYWPVTKDGTLTGYHVKSLNKQFAPFSVGDTRGADLLNWVQAKGSGAYRLIITEGPEDMASVRRVYQLYGKEEYQPAVVSLPHGAGSAKGVLQKHSEEINKFFKEVILCFDNDKAGQTAVENAMSIIPKALSVTLPSKDANECLVNGQGKALFNAFFSASKPKNTSLVFGSTLHYEARAPAKFGELSWPFPAMNDATRGIRLGETYYLGSGVKMGKTTLRNQIATHIIEQNRSKIFMASPEESNSKTYKLLAGQVVEKIFHDPKIEFDEKAYDRAGEVLKDNLALVNLYQHIGWESLKKDIVEAANWGAKAVFIDPITNLTNGIDAASTNTMLQEISQDLSRMALDHNLAVFIFCHLKAPEGNISADQRLNKYKQGKFHRLGNCPHEMGGDVLSNQFAGSRSMMRSCNMMLGLEGNKDTELEKEVRNMRWLTILEDREFGLSESFPIFYNDKTGKYYEA